VLLSLTLKDFVLVRSLSLDFSKGLTVLTGETGAGKSILLDALSMVLGDRADASVVREGASKAEITAEFSIAPPVIAFAEQAPWFDLPNQDETLLLRRVIDASGRSKAFVNGTPITLTQLKELAECLVDIHGQHAHYQLSKASTQLNLLDQWAGHDDLVTRVADIFKQWQRASQELDQLKQKQSMLLARRGEIEWQLESIVPLNLKPGDWEEIEADHKRLAHAQSLTETVATCVAQLEDGEQSLHKQLNTIVSKLDAAARIDQKLGEPLQMLDSACIALQEALYSLNDWLSTLDTDPHAFTELDEKINAIMDVSRKLRIPPALLHEQAQQLQQELDQLAQMDQIDTLEQQAHNLALDFDQAAKALSESRHLASKTLTKEVSAMMQTLHMAGGRFEASLISQEPSHSGLDSVEFLFAGHSGSSAKPLSKIASGGELARISLALAVVSSNTHWLETLVFDEVDTGIGGATAEVVGQLLRRLGQERQVLCVTHLAQVAAQGHHHWLVQKITENDEVYSNTRVLDREGRVEELARMMGGLNITETARQQAREWLKQRPSN